MCSLVIYDLEGLIVITEPLLHKPTPVLIHTQSKELLQVIFR